MARDLKLGLNTGYWAGGPPHGAAEAVAEAEKLGFDSIWTAEAYGSDCLTPLAVGRGDRAREAGHRDRADVRPPARRHRDGGDDARPPLRREIHPRSRCLGAAGGRGLVRHAVREAARPHTRVHRDHARHLGAQGTARGARTALPAAASRRNGPRQAAEVLDPSAPRGHTHLSRRRGPEEHRAVRRALDGWLALFFAPEHQDLYTGSLQEGFARTERAATPRTSRWRRRFP